MEYLEGGSLSEAAKKYDFEEDHIAFIGREMLKAISYLHSNRLVRADDWLVLSNCDRLLSLSI
jgi:serine/threonine protein kinase